MTTHKILQITDLHIMPKPEDTMLGIETEYFFRETLAFAHRQHGDIDLILLTGDLVQHPCPDSYTRIAQILVPYRTPCLCLPGNHDDFELMQRYLNQDNISCQKHKLFQDWQIIGLHSQVEGSAVGELATEELQYLQHVLQTHPDLPTLIALHHPCFATGSIWLDAMQIQNSEVFLSIIKHYPQIKAVTCGHVHQEANLQIDNTAILATPSSCFQFTPQSEFFRIDDTPPGYRIFELYADGRLESHCNRLPIRLENLDWSVQDY